MTFAPITKSAIATNFPASGPPAEAALLESVGTNTPLAARNGRPRLTCPRQGPSRSIVSLFCGAGGLDLGFAQEGFDTILAIDSDPTAVATFNLNHPMKPAQVANLATLSLDDFVAKVGSTGHTPLGVVGGPPCQGFSVGNVVGESCELRNSLPIIYARLIKRMVAEFDIAFFVFENVPGLLRKRHTERLAQMRAILDDFTIREFQVDAYDFGVPQHRARLIWIGLRRAMATQIEIEKPDMSRRPRTVRSAIQHLPEATFWQRNGNTSTVHDNHWTMRPKSARFASGSFNRWRSFRRLEWDAPSPTVAYGHREIHVHPDGTRRLSILEAMLLQGFPFEYKITGTLSEQVTQVSNAVPPPLAAAVAKTVLGALERGHK